MPARDLDRRLRRLEATAPPARSEPEVLAAAPEVIDAQVAEMLRGLPDPDDATWTPEHDRVLVEAAALYRRRGSFGMDAGPGHDLLADPAQLAEVSRILRAAL